MTQTPSAKPQKKRDPRLTILLDGLKRIFIHNWPTKLLALLLAIILWGGLITQDPTLTREKHFSSVSVSVSGEESVKRNGFIVTSDLTSLLGDVSLTADVPQMQYANAKATNYNVRIDLSRISAAGKQEIRILSTNSSTYGTVSSIQPSTVTIDVEEYITRFRIPVSVQTVGSAPDGYYAGAATLDPPTVTISGPKSMVDKIVRAEVVLELNNLPQREGTIRKALAYTLLDENNNAIESDLLEVTSESVLLDSVIVEQTMYAMKTLELSQTGLIQGTPKEGYEIKKISMTPENITVAGWSGELAEIDALFTDATIDVSGLSDSVKQRVRLSNVPELKYVSATYVNVTIEIGPVLKSKSFTNLPIQIEGLEAGYNASMSRVNASVMITAAKPRYSAGMRCIRACAGDVQSARALPHGGGRGRGNLGRGRAGKRQRNNNSRVILKGRMTMGSFINALFNFLLGWIRGTAQWLWSMVTSDSRGGLLGWAMRNLCIFGVVMDFLVYLIRWQPYRVWGNFWTRFLPKRARRTPTGRHLIYADGTMIEEEQVVQHTHKPKPAPKRESHAATRRKRVIPARRAHFGTTQTELTPPPLTIAQDKNQYHDNIPGGQA